MADPDSWMRSRLHLPRNGRRYAARPTRQLGTRRWRRGLPSGDALRPAPPGSPDTYTGRTTNYIVQSNDSPVASIARLVKTSPVAVPGNPAPTTNSSMTIMARPGDG